MSSISPLAPESLHRRCELSRLRFNTTADLEVLAGLSGQERAREAVSLGMSLRSRGYNLFVLGPAGLGKRSLVRDILATRAAEEPAPSDWCYVNNFAQPHRPRATIESR